MSSTPATPADPTNVIPVADEKPSPYAWKALWASTVGYAMDGFDFMILGFTLAAIGATFQLDQGAKGLIATVTLFGCVLGGIVGGILSDRIGRVRMLSYSILIFAVFTALTAFAPDFGVMLVLRFIAGIGIGAEFGIGMTLAAEAWPAAKRAQATSFVALGWQVGVILAAVCAMIFANLISGEWGWRGLFLFGSFPAVVAYFVRRHVEEPAMFEAHKEQARGKVAIGELFKDGATTKHSIAMIVLTSVQNFGYYGVMIWLPGYLATQHKMGINKSITWTIVTVLGMMVGIYVFGILADRIGRRPSLIGFQLGAVISIVVYARATDEMVLLIGGAIMGVFVNGMMGGYGALMAELYPTEVRATAQNVLFNIGRGIGGFGPLVMGILIVRFGFSTSIALLALLYVLDLVITLTMIPERKGVALE